LPIQQFILTLAKALKKSLAVNGLYLATFEVIVTAVEHFACLGKFGDITGHGIRKKLVGRASGLTDQLVNLGLQIWSEMYFHAFQRTEKAA
jgi:hypothetical protein